MADPVTIRVNDKEVQFALRNFSGLVKSEPLLKIAGAVMQGSILQTFRDEGSPPHSWPPLAASTLRQRGARSIHRSGSKRGGLQGILRGASRNVNAQHQILVRSGRLRNSIAEVIQGSRLVIGTNLKYAAIQQFGGRAGRKHRAVIPARPYLVFRPEDPARMEAAMERYIDQAAAQSGLGTK